MSRTRKILTALCAVASVGVLVATYDFVARLLHIPLEMAATSSRTALTRWYSVFRSHSSEFSASSPTSCSETSDCELGSERAGTCAHLPY